MARAHSLGRLQHCWRSSLAASRSILEPPAKQVGSVLLGSSVNVLLVCVPAGVALRCVSGPALATFIVNFLAAVGLLGLGDAALEGITSKVGTFYGSLLYISTRCVCVRVCVCCVARNPPLRHGGAMLWLKVVESQQLDADDIEHRPARPAQI